jgi:hypothetical protein
LELRRWEIAERLVESAVVEPADVFDHGELELGSGAQDAVGDQLRLEAVDERLGQRVVIGVTDRADRGQYAVIGQRLGVVDRDVLRGLNRSSQRCVREMNLGTAGDGALGLAAGTRLAWRGCRREDWPGGRAGAAIGAWAPFGDRSWARPASPCSAAVTQTLVGESRTSVAVGSGRRFQVLVEQFGGSSPRS